MFLFFTFKINFDRSESKNIFIMDTSSKENIQLFCKNSMQPVERPSFKTEYSSSEKKQPCCGELKVTNNQMLKTVNSEQKNNSKLNGVDTLGSLIRNFFFYAI